MILSKSDRASVQFLRYILVGTFGFLLDYTILFLLTEFCSVHYLISALIGFMAGLTLNYFLSICWVFSRRTLESKWLEFIIYASLGGLGLGLNELIIWIFTEYFAFHYMVSKSFYLIVYIFLFMLRKNLIFR